MESFATSIKDEVEDCFEVDELPEVEELEADDDEEVFKTSLELFSNAERLPALFGTATLLLEFSTQLFKLELELGFKSLADLDFELELGFASMADLDFSLVSNGFNCELAMLDLLDSVAELECSLAALLGLRPFLLPWPLLPTRLEASLEELGDTGDNGAEALEIC